MLPVKVVRPLFLFVSRWLVPQHVLTRMADVVARIRWRPWKNAMIWGFMRLFKVDLHEAAEDNINAYRDFDHFFTRRLKDNARPSDGANMLLSPVDGRISQSGVITGDQLVQCKNLSYSLPKLFSGYTDLARPFIGGHFFNLYLSPHNYHRIHMPLPGTLRHTLHVPGRLYGVGSWSTNMIPGLFAINERFLMLFETAIGNVCVIMVGACMVSGIETLWTGRLPSAERVGYRRYPSDSFCPAGHEIGCFHYGSTVILLTEKGRLGVADNLHAGLPVRVGQSLGSFRSALYV